MIGLGIKQQLTVVKEVEFGVYLAEREDAEEKVLLPAKKVPEGTVVGDRIEVFIYRDSKDRMISTTAEPYLKMGEYSVLRVVSVQKIGAFLDWGLEKDLFLPYKEQTVKVQEGDQILVRLYIDKSQRLCASMRGLYEILSKDSPYGKGDMVKGRIYEFSNNFGAFIAVDDKYSALLPRHEDHSHLHIGEVVEAKVAEVKPDGKLTLTMREKAYVQMEKDAIRVLELLDQYEGVLPFSDKDSKEIIMQETGMSKNAFKRAVGRLYREHKIEISEHSIQKK